MSSHPQQCSSASNLDTLLQATCLYDGHSPKLSQECQNSIQFPQPWHNKAKHLRLPFLSRESQTGPGLMSSIVAAVTGFTGNLEGQLNPRLWRTWSPLLYRVQEPRFLLRAWYPCYTPRQFTFEEFEPQYLLARVASSEAKERKSFAKVPHLGIHTQAGALIVQGQSGFS